MSYRLVVLFLPRPEPRDVPPTSTLVRFSLKPHRPFIGIQATVGSIDGVEWFHEPRTSRPFGEG